MRSMTKAELIDDIKLILQGWEDKDLLEIRESILELGPLSKGKKASLKLNSNQKINLKKSREDAKAGRILTRNEAEARTRKFLNI
jgi:hypothetical protein